MPQFQNKQNTFTIIHGLPHNLRNEKGKVKVKEILKLVIMMFPEQWMSSELGKILGFDPSDIVK